GSLAAVSRRGGTGYVASFSNTGNYPDALEHGDWHIPYGKVPLVVIEGGGNDATHGATDTAIIANATRLVKDLKASYPDAKFIMVGTLARGANYGGGRRTEVDTLLRHFANDQGIAFISAGDWITRYGLGTHMADSVHLKPAGHKILTDVLAAQLTSVGAPHAKPADPAS
ncbi:MAG: SGNH/GDSL hydrolase family protein, partial [Acidobacteria bacterium]|nr:SGNH/GDSL hydrolase family protein [Acidobacteriota bacterium]